MQIEVQVPDGRSGDWVVDTITVSDEEALFDEFTAWRNGLSPVKAGQYKRLRRGSTTVMSNTPMEISTNIWFIRRAKGHVLINGLGIGMVLTEVLKKEETLSVTVVEKSADVIALVGPTYSSDSRVTIVNADAFEYQPPKGVRYDYVWHDIWDDICTDNLEQMKKLHRKYGRRCDWQGSWSRDKLERIAAQEKKEARYWGMFRS